MGCITWQQNSHRLNNQHGTQDIEQFFRSDRFLSGQDACVCCTLQIGLFFVDAKHPYQFLVTQTCPCSIPFSWQFPYHHMDNEPTHSLALISHWMAIRGVLCAALLSLLFQCFLLVLFWPSLLWPSLSSSGGSPPSVRCSRRPLVNCSQQLEVISWLALKVWIISRTEQSPSGKQLPLERSCCGGDGV